MHHPMHVLDAPGDRKRHAGRQIERDREEEIENRQPEAEHLLRITILGLGSRPQDFEMRSWG